MNTAASWGLLLPNGEWRLKSPREMAALWKGREAGLRFSCDIADDCAPFDVRWTIRAPLATPDGLSDARVAAGVLERAAEQVRSRYGALDVAWGDVYRLRRDSLDLPASGGGSELGIFRVFGFEPAPGNKLVAASGDSYVAAIEFGSPVRAQALLTYGNASQPGSPHRTDQLPLAARQQLRPVWLTRTDVEQNLKFREWF